MSSESHIMRVMLKKFTKTKEPALMSHDAVVCRVTDISFARRVMTEACRPMLSTDFTPVINGRFSAISNSQGRMEYYRNSRRRMQAAGSHSLGP